MEEKFNILNIRGGKMSKKSIVIMPDTQKVLEDMGEQIKMARLRRNLSTELVAERAGISRAIVGCRKGNSYGSNRNICSGTSCIRWYG